MLDTKTQSLQNRLWEELKIESSVGGSIYVIAAVILIALALLAIWKFAVRRYRAWYLKNG